MASIHEPRPGRFQVKWRLGNKRDGKQQNELFDNSTDALHFKVDVEASDGQWPVKDGMPWVKGMGYMTPAQLAALEAEEQRALSHPWLTFTKRHIESKLAARDIGPDAFRRYKQYAGAFQRAVPAALRLAEILEGDDDLRLRAITEPTSVADLLDSLPDVDQEIVIEDVDRDTIAAWVTYMRVRGALPKTIRNHHGFLHGVFEDAVESELLTRNPCAHTKLGKREAGRAKVILERPEFWMIHDSMRSEYRDFIAAAVFTGMRFGELTALTVADWDRGAGNIRVNKAWKRGITGHEIGSTKTKAGERTVWVGKMVAEIFDKNCEGKAPTDLIFTAPRGGRLRQNEFGNRWLVAVATAQQQLGLTKAPRFHDLRHTHISWLRDANLHDVAIKDLVGHSDASITGIYGGVTQETIDAARSAMDRSFLRVVPNAS